MQSHKTIRGVNMQIYIRDSGHVQHRMCERVIVLALLKFCVCLSVCCQGITPFYIREYRLPRFSEKTFHSQPMALKSQYADEYSLTMTSFKWS